MVVSQPNGSASSPAPPSPAEPSPQQRRQWLLGPNAGAWHGTFIRCAADGVEQERFPTRLAVEEQNGTIDASLTYVHTGQVRSMRFAEPPPEMQISPAGHWSLGPDRVGPWPFFAELCLVHGDRRRRVVLRHGSENPESLVVVVEARPGVADPAPAVPLVAALLGPGHWSPEPGLEIATASGRCLGDPVCTSLRWSPEPGLVLEISRRYGASGLLEPLAGAGGATGSA